MLIFYVRPGWDNRSFSSSQAQAADAIGLDQRCSAGGWIAGQGQDLLERLVFCLPLISTRSASEMVVHDIEMQ